MLIADVLDHIERHDGRRRPVRHRERLGVRSAQRGAAPVLLDHPLRDGEPDERVIDAEARHAVSRRGAEQHARTTAEVEEARCECGIAKPIAHLHGQPVGSSEHLPRARLDLRGRASRLRSERVADHLLERLRAGVAQQAQRRLAILVHVDP